MEKVSGRKEEYKAPTELVIIVYDQGYDVNEVTNIAEQRVQYMIKILQYVTEKREFLKAHEILYAAMPLVEKLAMDLNIIKHQFIVP